VPLYFYLCVVFDWFFILISVDLSWVCVYLCCILFFCSSQLDTSVVRCVTKDGSPVACSGDDQNSVSWILASVSGDLTSDIVESQFSVQNNVSSLPEGSTAETIHCSQPGKIKNASFDDGTLATRSPAVQTMKRADSLPSTLLWYVFWCNDTSWKYIVTCTSCQVVFFFSILYLYLFCCLC